MMGSLVSGLWYFIYGAGLVCIGFSAYFWKASLYKAQLYAQAMQYLALSGDNKWKVTDVPDPGSFPDDAKWVKRKVIFIRHGESNWNETFNRGFNPIFFIPRVLYACGFELYLLLQGVRDSWFYDSSLSPLGLKQTESLRKAVLAADHPDLQTLAGKGQSSVIVSSPLRRTMSTAIYGMYDRLEKDEDKILILPCLQEISRNMDTLPLTPAYSNPQPSWIEAADKNANMVKMYRDRVDVTQYTGNKAVKSTGLSRLLTFNQWLFTTSGGSDDVVIVSGHSLWFRSFFKTFLARASNHKSKNKKMKNCGVVSLTVMSTTDSKGTTHYKIDESSITEVHLGFE
jgi:broad specificity phosphatase PhoE